MIGARISHSRKTLRFRTVLPLQDPEFGLVMLDALIEMNYYDNTFSFCAVEAEGLFFTTVVEGNEFDRKAFKAIRDWAQVEYNLDCDPDFYAKKAEKTPGSGVPVIPEQKLSTGKKVGLRSPHEQIYCGSCGVPYPIEQLEPMVLRDTGTFALYGTISFFVCQTCRDTATEAWPDV